MTWSYNAANLSTSLNQVRWLIADTDTADQLITDEEIAFALTQNSNVFRAGAICCRSIALKVGQRLTTNSSGTGIDGDEQYEHWMFAAAELDKQADAGAGTSSGSGGGAAAYAGGISVSDKDSVAADTDRVRPAFVKNVHTGPGDLLGSTESELETLER